MKSKFTAILRHEEDMYVAFSPELDIASQGESANGALANLKEAVELFLETASLTEFLLKTTKYYGPLRSI